MNANVKAWVEALRSGEYKQGKSFLRQDNAYCCLGVACDLYQKATGKGEWRPGVTSGTQTFSLLDSHSDAFLPRVVAVWLEISSNTIVDDGTHRRSLIGFNDSGSSFEEIANIIETNYPRMSRAPEAFV